MHYTSLLRYTESLDELTDWVCELFEPVKDRRSEEDKKEVAAVPEHKKTAPTSLAECNAILPFDQSILPFRILYSPVKELRQLRLMWQLPSLRAAYR